MTSDTPYTENKADQSFIKIMRNFSRVSRCLESHLANIQRQCGYKALELTPYWGAELKGEGSLQAENMRQDIVRATIYSSNFIRAIRTVIPCSPFILLI